MYQFIIIFCTDKNLFNRSCISTYKHNVHNDSWMFKSKKIKHLYICSVYLCICAFIFKCLPAQHADGTTVLPWCCFQENLLQARHRIASGVLHFLLFYFGFFFLNMSSKNATFNFTAVLSFGRSRCQHRRVNSSKTWSVLLKLMTYGILHLQWNISHTRLRGSGCLPITFAQQLNIAMGKTYHDWIKMFVIPYE